MMGGNVHLTLADDIHPIALPIDQFDHNFPDQQYGLLSVKWNGEEGIPENLVAVFSGDKKVYPK